MSVRRKYRVEAVNFFINPCCKQECVVPPECDSFWKGVVMSKQLLGKTLLRNVIRHTDAHNKIQEETEMWKMRGWEVHKHLPDTKNVRGQMHCDRVSDQPRDLSRSRERVSEHDDREARYWSRKLYEFKASDPDRWGHSGFKELYPEEFESDRSTRKVGRHKMKKSKSDMEASLSKRSKKSSRKKKKKKKKEEEEKRKKEECSSSDSSSDDSSATKDKQQRKKTKSRHKNKKTERNRGRDDDDSSSSGDSDGEEERERRTHRRKKRKQDSHKDSN